MNSLIIAKLSVFVEPAFFQNTPGWLGSQVLKAGYTSFFSGPAIFTVNDK